MANEGTRILVLVLIQDVVLLALTVLVFWAGVFAARRFGSEEAGYGLGALGLARPKGGYVVGTALGLAVGAGTLVASLILTPLSLYVAQRLGYSTDLRTQEPLMRSVREWVAESPGTAIPAAIFVMIVFAPAVEEIIFRGAIFGGLYRLFAFLSSRLAGREGGGKKGEATGTALPLAFAALLSSAFFALLHLEPLILPALLTLAVALCVLYRKTGSILPTFVTHATFNSLAVLVIVLGGLSALPAPQ